MRIRENVNHLIVLTSVVLLGVAGLRAQTPPIPTNLNAQNIPGDRPTIMLTWQVPAGPWHFKIYRSEGDSTDFEAEGWSMTPGFADHEVLFSHTYYYYVTSVNQAFVESPPSEIAHVTVSISGPHGHVSGTVISGMNHQPLPNVRVSLYRVTNMQYRSAPSFTNLSGQYQVEVDTGTYFIKAEPPQGSQYRYQWFVNAPDPSSATAVAVTDSGTVVADFSLSTGSPLMMAHVSGIVQSDGARLQGATVVFMRTMQEMSFLAATTGHTPGLGSEARNIPALGYTRGVIWAEAPTDQYGQYTALVPSGASYIAVATKNGYLPQYFDHESDPTQADIIAVRNDTTGIDFDLSEFPDVQNSIRGTVTDTTGQPVPSRVILFPKPPGTQPPATTRFIHSDSLGNFNLTHVASGVYDILAVPYSDFAPSFYRQGAFGVIHWQEADSIFVSGLVSGVDVGVVSIQSSGLTRVSGNVTALNGGAVPGSRVVARTPDGLTVGSAVSDETGHYSIEAVPVGMVTVYGDRIGYSAGQGTVNIPPNTYVVNSNVVLGGNGSTNVETRGTGIYAFALEESYPNPFNPTTTIRYTIPERTRVVIKVFNILGKEVATLVNEVQDPGAQSVRFDASGLASGMYFYRLEAQGFVEVKKTLLLK